MHDAEPSTQVAFLETIHTFAPDEMEIADTMGTTNSEAIRLAL